MKTGYGNIEVYLNGQVCSVFSTLDGVSSFAVREWTEICAVPAWANVKSAWLTLYDSGGNAVGIWTVSGGKLRVLPYAKLTDAVIKGIFVPEQ